LHWASENGLANLTKLLLEKQADPNLKTSKLTNSQTALHKAILNSHEDIVDVFIQYKGKSENFSLINRISLT
jgi:ankyrin repeat protein